MSSHSNTPLTRNASDRDETGKTNEINKTGDEHGIRVDDAGRNGEYDENDADDGALAPRRWTRTNKGQITKDYWMNKPRDEAGHGLCAFNATDSEFASHPPTQDRIVEPASYEQARQSPQRVQWLQAMNDEIAALTKLKTFELAQLPKGRKAIGRSEE